MNHKYDVLLSLAMTSATLSGCVVIEPEINPVRNSLFGDPLPDNNVQIYEMSPTIEPPTNIPTTVAIPEICSTKPNILIHPVRSDQLSYYRISERDPVGVALLSDNPERGQYNRTYVDSGGFELTVRTDLQCEYYNSDGVRDLGPNDKFIGLCASGYAVGRHIGPAYEYDGTIKIVRDVQITRGEYIGCPNTVR